MSKFQASKIGLGQASVAEQLRITRNKLGVSIADAALATKVSSKYLEALEDGQYHKLPEGIYSLNFLREYGQYLGLDYQKLQTSFLEEKKVLFSRDHKNLFASQIVATKNLIVMPHLIRNIIWGVVLLSAFVYIVWLMNNIFRAPTLVLITPGDNFVTSQEAVLVSGKTDPETEITINAEAVMVTRDGDFSQTVNLNQGVNTIVIEAKKGNKAVNKVVKEVLLKASQN